MSSEDQPMMDVHRQPPGDEYEEIREQVRRDRCVVADRENTILGILCVVLRDLSLRRLYISAANNVNDA